MSGKPQRESEEGDVGPGLVQLRRTLEAESGIDGVRRQHGRPAQEDQPAATVPSRPGDRLLDERGADAAPHRVGRHCQHAQPGVVGIVGLGQGARGIADVGRRPDDPTVELGHEDGGHPHARPDVTQPRLVRPEIGVDGAVGGDGDLARSVEVGRPGLADDRTGGQCWPSARRTDPVDSTTITMAARPKPTR